MSVIETITDYEKTIWKNGKVGGTSINESKLNNLEEGVYQNRGYIKQLNEGANDCLPLTGGTVTGRLKVYAEGTTADPRLDVQSARVDMLKTDGGDSAVKVTQSEVVVNVPFKAKSSATAKNIYAETIRPKETNSTAGMGRQSMNIMASGANQNGSYNVGMSIEANTAEASTTEAKVAVGRFNSTDIDTLTAGMVAETDRAALFTTGADIEVNAISSGTIKATANNIYMNSGNFIVKDGANNPVFQSSATRTKMRTEKTNAGEVGYVEVNKSGNVYAGKEHRFLDENESNPVIISGGTIQTNGLECYFARAFVVQGGESIALKSAVDVMPFLVFGRGQSTNGSIVSGFDVVIWTNANTYQRQVLTSSAVWYSMTWNAEAGGVLITPNEGYTAYITVIGPCIITQPL